MILQGCLQGRLVSVVYTGQQQNYNAYSQHYNSTMLFILVGQIIVLITLHFLSINSLQRTDWRLCDTARIKAVTG